MKNMNKKNMNSKNVVSGKIRDFLERKKIIKPSNPNWARCFKCNREIEMDAYLKKGKLYCPRCR